MVVGGTYVEENASHTPCWGPPTPHTSQTEKARPGLNETQPHLRPQSSVESSQNPQQKMASNVALRRIGLATTAISAYTATVYFTYQYMVNNAEESKSLISNPSCGCSCKSYVNDPDRNQTYQRIAEAYDAEISREEAAMGMNLLRRALLYFHAEGKALEVGAGTGRNLGYYSSNVNEIILTDVSDQMLLQARSKVKNLKEGGQSKFKLFVADALNMTKYYKENEFDTVVDTFGLCSFDEPVEVLRELQRVCKPGGKILLLEHGRSKSFDGLNKYLDRNAERHAKNWGCVFNRDIDQIIDDAGLDIEIIRTWHFGTTYYVVCRPGPGKYVPRVRTPNNEDTTSTDTSNATRFSFVRSWLRKNNR